MNWKRIPKEKAIQPSKGVYSDWKEILAEEADHQCVYCAIHDACFGGLRNFHVEHYRPKLKFNALENTICNLYYACAICNTFKSDDWPDEPIDFSRPCYPDPSQHDYSTIFNWNTSGSGEITGNNVSAKYMIEKLYLNRAQLIMQRRIHFMSEGLNGYIVFFKNIIPELLKDASPKAKGYLAKLALAFMAITSMEVQLQTITPYKKSDITKK